MEFSQAELAVAREQELMEQIKFLQERNFGLRAALNAMVAQVNQKKEQLNVVEG